MKFQKRVIEKSEGGTGKFLKLEDGQSVIGVFRGEIFEFFQYWEGQKSHIVTADHPKAKSRFRLNFLTKDDGIMKAKVFEFPTTVYNQLADLSDEYDLEKTAVKITRRGVGTDTVYMIIPSKEQPSAAQLKSYESIELHELAPAQPQAPQALKNYAPGGGDSDNLPF